MRRRGVRARPEWGVASAPRAMQVRDIGAERRPELHLAVMTGSKFANTQIPNTCGNHSHLMSATLTDRLSLDAGETTRDIASSLRSRITQVLRRSGLVVAMSGGIDRAVCAALAVEPPGPPRGLGLALPVR